MIDVKFFSDFGFGNAKIFIYLWIVKDCEVVGSVLSDLVGLWV